MRDVFRSDLAQLAGTLVAMAAEVRQAMRQATKALLEADEVLAQNVLDDDASINAMYRNIEETAYELLARQSPVAGDLRAVITSLHIATDIERMGDLAEHIAKTSLRRQPAQAVPEELQDTFAEMGRIADRMAGKVVDVLAHRDATLGAELEHDDDVMDAHERKIFQTLFGDWSHGVEAAVDSALLARFYERYADHAVNAGKQVVYLVTGSGL